METYMETNEKIQSSLVIIIDIVQYQSEMESNMEVWEPQATQMAMSEMYSSLTKTLSHTDF